MRYGILGGLEVEDGARTIVLGARKQRLLLIRLLLDASEVVSADELIEALWPSRPPRSAAKLVHVYVSQVRRSLGGSALETRAPGYLLRVGPGELDAHRFEQELADARAALGAGNAALGASLYGRALSLWRGSALQDVAYEPFALAEAQRLEELRLVCLEGRLDSELRLGRHDDVLAEIEALIREHPLRERLRSLLMLALYRAGRQADALECYRETAALLRDELGLEPGDELRELERGILNQDPALAAPPVVGSGGSRVPVAASSLVGRERELDRLAGLVSRSDVRIVTLNGAGGCGKTRVALELAKRLEPGFANGVVLVELAPLADQALVVATIGRALDLGETAGEDPVAELARRLQGQELLLVLDNFEHVVAAARDLPRLVSLAPRVTLLVTSRRVLHVSGEHVFPLEPLPEDDAVRLFVERAEARHGSAQPGDREAIRAICRRLDGLPLAIELAAARAATLTPSALLERLASGVAALGTGPRDAPARQQTLADTLAWSTDLLDPGERRTFARLAVFRGGCTVDAAEAVAGATLDQVEALVDSSLVQRGGEPDEPRLALLETVREHAEALLEAAGERTEVEAAHGRYFSDLLAGLELKWPQGESGLALVDREIDNLRAAYERAAGRGDEERALLIATTLFPYWWVRGRFREGRDRIGRLVERVDDAALQARALHALAALQWLTGDAASAEASASRGIATGTASGALQAVARCHTILGIVARDRGHYAEAAEHFERSGALAAELGHEDEVVDANENLADLALQAGRLEEAGRRWEWVISRLREQGLPEEAETMPRFGLGSVAFQQGRLDDAHRDFVEAHELATRAGFPHMGALALSGLAAVAAANDDPVEAALVLGQAWQLMDTTGGEPGGNEAVMFEFARAAALEALGEEQFEALLERGRARLSEHTFPSDPPQ